MSLRNSGISLYVTHLFESSITVEQTKYGAARQPFKGRISRYAGDAPSHDRGHRADAGALSPQRSAPPRRGAPARPRGRGELHGARPGAAHVPPVAPSPGAAGFGGGAT